MIVAPANWMNGIAERAATAMQDQIGVCNRGLTRASGLDPGSWSSRDIPKHNRTVEVMIDMQQTKIAAETTSKYTVMNAPMIEASTALGASRLGSFVSSASVDAVSKP